MFNRQIEYQMLLGFPSHVDDGWMTMDGESRGHLNDGWMLLAGVCGGRGKPSLKGQSSEYYVRSIHI